MIGNDIAHLSTVRGNFLHMGFETKAGAVNKSGAYIKDDRCVLV